MRSVAAAFCGFYASLAFVALSAILPPSEAAAVDLVEDAPVVRPPRAGDIRGTISPAGKVQVIWAVSRTTKKTYQADSFNGRTGKFVFKGLPGDATYDVCVKTSDGRTLEGIDLNFVDHRLLRLAVERRKQLKLPPERPHEFDQEDVKELVKYVDGLKDFMDDRRILYVHGQGRRATLLLELLRTRDFYAKAGSQIIWRVELWYFEFQYGGWDQVKDTAKVLRRERIQLPDFRQITLEYYPQLSVYILPTGYAKPLKFKIPDKADPTRGRIPAAPMKLEIKPHVSGLDVKPEATSKPTTQKGDKESDGKAKKDKNAAGKLPKEKNTLTRPKHRTDR